jgi:hypothetical protein
MSREKWVLEIYRANGGKDYIATAQFESLPLLRTAVIENRGKRFVVGLPSHASAADRIALLDLRAQGFDIAIRAARTH